MTWVLLFLGLALAGLVVLAVYAAGLPQKADGLRAEIAVLRHRVEALLDLVGRVEFDRLRRH